MRKLIFTALVSAVALAIAPASALAHHHRGARHARIHHARRHARFHFRRFGSQDFSTTGSSSTPSGNSAGKVSSFTGGVLTITLNDGSQVSGKVTDGTDCISPTSTSSGDQSGSGDQSSGSSDQQSGSTDQSSGSSDQQSGSTDQSSGSGDQQSGSGDQSSGSGDQSSGSSDQQTGDDDGGDSGSTQACTSSNLTPGAVVQAAILKVTDGGATWDKIELAQ